MTVGEMLDRMSSSEFSEWMAYNAIEPFGPQREDLRAGSIASPLVNLQIRSGRKKTKPSDWLMKFGKQEPMDPEAMKALFKALADAGKKRQKNKQQSKPQPKKKR